MQPPTIVRVYVCVRVRACVLQNPQKAKATRRFLVVEGLYANHGDIAPLDKLVRGTQILQLFLGLCTGCIY